MCTLTMLGALEVVRVLTAPYKLSNLHYITSHYIGVTCNVM